MTNNNNFKSKVILVLASLIIIIALGIIYQVLALNSPTNQPPTGGGTIGVGLNAPVNSLYIDSAGNVGIGTTNPSYKLEVAGGLQALLVSNDGLNGSDKTTFFSVYVYIFMNFLLNMCYHKSSLQKSILFARDS